MSGSDVKHNELGPDYFGYYKHLFFELLDKNDDNMFSLLGSNLESPVKWPSRKDEGSNGQKCGRKGIGCSNHLSFFTEVIGENLSEFKKERLKAILHECAVCLNQELNETFGHILATLKISSEPAEKGPLCYSSALNNDTNDPLCSKKHQELSSTPHNSGIYTDILSSRLGRTVFKDIQAINGDDRISEEAIQMYSSKMLEKLTKMEEDLEEFLNTVVSKCRPMTSAEKQRLGSQIQKLPEKAFDRVVEIVRPQISSADALAGRVLVNLEEQDDVTLWRLYYHVQDVIKANQL